MQPIHETLWAAFSLQTVLLLGTGLTGAAVVAAIGVLMVIRRNVEATPPLIEAGVGGMFLMEVPIRAQCLTLTTEKYLGKTIYTDRGKLPAAPRWAERRRFPRRSGNPIAVRVCDPDRPDCTWDGHVLDRSTGGLCLSINASFERNRRLLVRPTCAGTLPWTLVEVRHCRYEGRSWTVGCKFESAPQSAIMMHFG